MKKLLYSLLIALGLIPTIALASVITVKPGDTLSEIAKQVNTTWQNLAIINNLNNPNLIFPGQKIQTDSLLGGAILPTDNYDTFITSPLSSSATTTYVNALPVGVSESIYTIFATDGVTPVEKIYCTGTATNPNRLTFCTRGVSFNPVNGVIDETGGVGLTIPRNSRIAITDNINFSGKALAMLYGNQSIPGNPVNFQYIPITTTTLPTLPNQLVPKLYVDNVGAGGFTASNVSTTRGLSVDGSSPERVGINVSSTTGMAFGPDGKLYQKVSSTLALKSDANGIGISTSTLLPLIATNTPTALMLPISTASGTLTINWVATSTLPNSRGFLSSSSTGAQWVDLGGDYVSSSPKDFDIPYQNTSPYLLFVNASIYVDNVGSVEVFVSSTPTVGVRVAEVGGQQSAGSMITAVSFYVRPGYYYKIIHSGSGTAFLAQVTEMHF